MKSKNSKFPKGFLFGSATSAHQIEGNQKNDWSRWEEIPGNIVNGDSSEVAASSSRRWREDIELLIKTGQNAYRFSIEWSRIEPEEGIFDDEAIKHYLIILKELKRNNIRSMLTLFHFTLPQWLDDKGGFTYKNFPFLFARFVEKVVKSYAGLVDFYCTFNEPNVYISTGFILGNWYPGRKNDYIGAYRVYRNYLRAHSLAYEVIKASSSSSVGPVINITGLLPLHQSYLDQILVRIAKYFDYKIFIKPVVDKMDFLGLNYYNNKFVHLGKKMFRGGFIYKLDGWQANQKMLRKVLVDQKCWNKPIIITENGIPDEKDEFRAKYIKQGLNSISLALRDGADVRGYFYWSLLDNFEWASGYSMKFGLATIDRKLRKSALEYKRLINDNKS